uniref:Uncharacterized protein n=1 Tax=uncultured marine virus TaxID=186617 RepID=A0A0F7L7P4_9VIRU|nr:hypothetical protein [uncultured marine virus]
MGLPFYGVLLAMATLRACSALTSFSMSDSSTAFPLSKLLSTSSSESRRVPFFVVPVLDASAVARSSFLVCKRFFIVGVFFASAIVMPLNLANSASSSTSSS